MKAIDVLGVLLQLRLQFLFAALVQSPALLATLVVWGYRLIFFSTILLLHLQWTSARTPLATSVAALVYFWPSGLTFCELSGKRAYSRAPWLLLFHRLFFFAVLVAMLARSACLASPISTGRPPNFVLWPLLVCASAPWLSPF